MYYENFVEEAYKKALDTMYWTYKTRKELIEDGRAKNYRNNDQHIHMSLVMSWTDRYSAQLDLIYDMFDIEKEQIEADLEAMM